MSWPEEVIRSQELEFQEVINSLEWVLGTELGSSEKLYSLLTAKLSLQTNEVTSGGRMSEW